MKDEKLEDVKNKLLESYGKGAGVNHIAGPSLPSRESIKKILMTIDSLMFPGFQADEIIEESMLGYRTSEKLNSLLKDIYNEIKKASCKQFKTTVDCTCEGCSTSSMNNTLEFISRLTKIRSKIILDAQAALNGDPAAASMDEILLCYPGLKAVLIHRIAHELYTLKIPLIPRMMGEYAHSETGIDIHPGATIGDSFFIDHGTGVVIGETTVIGKRVKIYQGVTLGALSVKKEEANVKRHPTIEDDVTIYAGATILGGETIVGENSTIGGNVWIVRSVKMNSKIYNKPIDYTIKN